MDLQSLASLSEIIGTIVVLVSVVYLAVQVPFTSSFTSFVESLIKDNPTDADSARRWRDFVANDKQS